MSVDAGLVIALVLLCGGTVALLACAAVRVRRQVVIAAVRAAVQLALIGAVLRLVFQYPYAVGIVLLVMLSTACWTAGRRLRELSGALRAVAVSSVLAVSLTLAVIFLSGAVDFSARYVVALGGIVLGGTMIACTLAGRQLLAGIRNRRDEVEGWLALGATPRQANADIVRTAAGEALLPAIDQTRTVGLVTLPGAFVGALFGGASPATAARFQLVVLVGLLAAETAAAVCLTWMLGAPSVLPLSQAEIPASSRQPPDRSRRLPRVPWRRNPAEIVSRR